MFEDIFFAIAYFIMGLFYDRKYGCLTAIIIVLAVLIMIAEIVY